MTESGEMATERESSASFSSWIVRPQSLIALAAVVLSLCGLFIAIYEASLLREQQRASVWPYVEVGPSLTRERFEVRVRNAGVGPARIRAAAVSRDGETTETWLELIRRVGVDPAQVSEYFSLIHGRVIPSDSEAEAIFRVTEEDGPAAVELVEQLSRETYEGRIDVELCYCSVYDECWTSNLQDIVQRLQGVEPSVGDRAVDNCDSAPRSAI